MVDRRWPRPLAVAVSIATVVVAATACLPDTSVIDARLARAVVPASPPATGCAEVCGVALRVTSAQPSGDQLEYDKVFGTATGTEIIPIASASKWLAGAVILSLVDSGDLSLGSTVGQYFPAYAGTPKGSITLTQLFSHTSGVTHLDHACLGSSAFTLATCADAILATDLDAAPGTRFAYGGNSMQVAGRMAELATGTSWTALVRDRLTAPLALTKTSWFGTNPRIGGGAVSTLADYDAFLAMIQHDGVGNGRRILSSDAIAAMETDRIAGLPIASSPNPITDGYGIGVWIQHDSTGTSLTSPGLYGTFPVVDRGRCYRSVLFETSTYLTALSQMSTIKPELDRQLRCR